MIQEHHLPSDMKKLNFPTSNFLVLRNYKVFRVFRYFLFNIVINVIVKDGLVKKNRIILQKKPGDFPERVFRSALNGVMEQAKDQKMETADDLMTVTNTVPDKREITAPNDRDPLFPDAEFAEYLVKDLFMGGFPNDFAKGFKSGIEIHGDDLQGGTVSSIENSAR